MTKDKTIKTKPNKNTFRKYLVLFYSMTFQQVSLFAFELSALNLKFDTKKLFPWQ